MSSASPAWDSKDKQIIIQCPSCQTKFALDAEVLEGVDEPRFHCSRCDHVFNMEESKPPFVSALEDSSINEAAGNVTGPDVDFAPPPPPRPRAQIPSRSLEIPAKPHEPLRASPPHERVTDEFSFGDAQGSQMEFDFGALDRAIENRLAFHEDSSSERSRFPMRPISMESESSPPSEEDLPASKQYDFIAEPLPREDFTSLKRTAPETELASAPDLFPGAAIDSTTISASARASYCDWRGVWFFAAPLAVFLVFLAVFSFSMRANPALAAWVSQSFFSSAPRLAPPGLYIKNSRISTVTLDNGERAHIVSGKVVNNTNHIFRQIALEAISFDETGQILAKTRIDGSTTLAKTRIKSLIPDMIRAIQKARPAKNWRLTPGEEHNFALALGLDNLSDEISRGKFFSVRIYSVKY